MKLPKAEQNLGEWQAAIECLILVAEKNGPTMMARIGMMKAPCRGRVRVPPGRHRLDSRAIVSRGHGPAPNASMDARSMSTTITFRSDGAGLRSHRSPASNRAVRCHGGGSESLTRFLLAV